MILIALGSNIEPRAEYLAKARELLQRQGVDFIRASMVMEFPALLVPDAPKAWNMPFFNQVLAVRTSQTPERLLRTLKEIEQELGRTNHGHWGPREIDLDLLAYDALVMDTESLTLPHPQLHKRDFVLEPLVEIAPEWRHPTLNRTAAQLLKALP